MHFLRSTRGAIDGGSDMALENDTVVSSIVDDVIDEVVCCLYVSVQRREFWTSGVELYAKEIQNSIACF
jgi:catabolite regulation protein CreA